VETTGSVSAIAAKKKGSLTCGSTKIYGEGHSRPTQPHSKAQSRGWRERAQAGYPTGLGAGRRAFASPTSTGVPRHRWRVLLSDGHWSLSRCRPRLGRSGPVRMSSSTPPGSPEGCRSAVAPLRRQDRRHVRGLGGDRGQRQRSRSSIGGPRPAAVAFLEVRSRPLCRSGRRP
jgi:hypothetical protein